MFAAEDLPQLTASPVLNDALARARRRRLISTYFDTPDKMLWRHGVSLRVRRTEDGRVQTLKQETPSLVERGEWEHETDQDEPDIAAIEKRALGSWFSKRRLRGHVEPQFTVDVERASITVERDHARIEAALDEGVIEADGRTNAVRELELELKEGENGALYDLARILSQQAPVYLSFISKAERGFLFDEGEWGRSVKATRPKLTARIRCGEAFAAICRSCLHDFMLNMQALETTDRIEAVHRGRVALRRLRAALQLFEPVVGDDAFQHLDDELKWLSHLFGEARDLDVFQESTFLPAAENASNLGATELADHTGAKRDAAHDAVNAAVKSERVRLLLVDLVRWIEDGSWRRNEATGAEKPLKAFALPALRKRRKKLVKKGS
jgi:inorganic triphosphatase YgiF